MNNDLLVYYKKFFDNMYKGINDDIVLDEEQRKAIVADDSRALVIAGAGTGKTTTMAAKVKFLVDKKNINPQKILVMSYTKKATQALEELIVDEFGIDAHVSTFHALGFDYVRNANLNSKCTVIDYNDRERIFYNYFSNVFKNKSKLEQIHMLFIAEFEKSDKWMFSRDFMEHYKDFDTYEDYYKDYKEREIRNQPIFIIENKVSDYVKSNLNGELIKTIRGEVVKSAAECVIANYLFSNNIDYSYEKVYDQIMEDRKSYKPDFTIHYAGRTIYLEYFGLNDYKYNKIKKKKIEFHKRYNNEFIYLENLNIEDIEVSLKKELNRLNIKGWKKDVIEIYNQILDNNRLRGVFPLKNFFYNCVDKIKESLNRDHMSDYIKEYINDFLDTDDKQLFMNQWNVIAEFYNYYNNELYHSSDVRIYDYPDLIYYGNKAIEKNISSSLPKFDYIIIDEYQDISASKYLLTKNTAKAGASKIFAVGDDWQSIYSFSGSKIEYIYNFKKIFPDAKIYRINKTYRNSQELIDTSGEFIMKNSSQIKKNLISEKHNRYPIIFKDYTGTKLEDEDNALKEVINEIHKKNSKHNILVLGRYNKNINNIYKDKDFIDDLDTRVVYKPYKDLYIDAMTIHKSKGLTYDEVIIIGMNNKFPMKERNDFWLIDLLKNKVPEEGINYPEERRLLYVALTRTKNNVYILSNYNSYFRSPFIDELKSILKKDN